MFQLNSYVFRQCNLHNHHENYTFIKYHSNSAHFMDDELAPFLKTRNVSNDVIAYIRDKLTSARTKHSTATSSVKPFLEERLRDSPYLMSLVMKLFYNDYKAFGFKLPPVPQ